MKIIRSEKIRVYKKFYAKKNCVSYIFLDPYLINPSDKSWRCNSFFSVGAVFTEKFTDPNQNKVLKSSWSLEVDFKYSLVF